MSPLEVEAGHVKTTVSLANDWLTLHPCEVTIRLGEVPSRALLAKTRAGEADGAGSEMASRSQAGRAGLGNGRSSGSLPLLKDQPEADKPTG